MPKRILVADDSATIQKAFAMVFGGQDVTLVAARSADEAMSAARNGRPDLIIADAALGNSNGYDLCAALKAEPGTRAVPVLILASNHVPYDETRGHRVGAAGSLLKPFESQSLIDQVGAALAKVDGSRAPAPAAAAPQPIQVRETARVDPAPVDDDDDYGEFTIERPPIAAPPTVANVRPPPAFMAPPPSRPAPPVSAPVSAPAAAPALRPSLIPGVRPGAPLPARPAPAPAAAPAAAATLPSSPGVHRQAMGRTMMGLPAMAPPAAPAAAPVQARPAPAPAPLRPAAPAPAPVQVRPAMPAPAPRPAPMPAPAAVQAPAPVVAALSSAVAQKVAAIAARGPEYEAIAKLSREIIEQVVWEVVPELAEVIIRQEVDRLASAKR
jgi:CheY-like chemotaxis protein